MAVDRSLVYESAVGWVERSEAHRQPWWASLRSTHPTIRPLI